MTDRIALAIFLVITLALFLDYWFQDLEGLIFLAGKMSDLIEWMAFWR